MSTDYPRAVRVLRAIANMDRDELAAKSGVGYSTLSALERGTSEPTRETIERLARGLGVTGEQFAAAAEGSIVDASGGRVRLDQICAIDAEVPRP